jgi:hypothetical protein
MSKQPFILDSLMNEIINSVHESRIINKEEIVTFLKLHPLFGSILGKADDLDFLEQRLTKVSEAKKETKKYPKYVFTEDAIMALQNFYDYMYENYPTRKILEKDFPLFITYIAQIYDQPKEAKQVVFEPKTVEIDIDKPLYHTTNAFEIFEMEGAGTPYGPAWFTIDSIYPIDKIAGYHEDRGGMRVLKYKWNTSNPLDFEVEYPFIDVQANLYPRIMDGRKIKYIPPKAIEKYFEENGMILDLPNPNMNENILMTYGKTWRPFVTKYLESFGFDGVLIKDQQIAVFHPERWLTFENVEYGDILYSSLIEALKKKNKNQLEVIADKNNLDKRSLQILYNKNIAKIPIF